MLSWKSAFRILGNIPGDHDMFDPLTTDWLTARARATPRATALIIGERNWSYSQLDDLVHQVASYNSRYAKQGWRIASLLPNNLAHVCIIHAATKIGATLVPLNTRLTGRELTWHLQHSNCELLVYDDETVDRLVLSDLQNLSLISSKTLFADRAGREDDARPSFSMSGVQAIVFTSGTTGKPKGAMLTFANQFYSAAASAFRLGISRDDRWLCCLPLYHVGGLAILLRSCLYGTAVVLQDRFDVQQVSKSLDNDEITLISLVPTMLFRLLQYRDGRQWPSSLRYVLLGGAAASPELLAQCRALNIPVATTYGLTEAASQVTTMLPEDSVNKPGSVGRPILFTSVDILSADGRSLPPGEAGEIVVSGPTIMLGYDSDAESTAQRLKDGRLLTGDIGYLDDDGDLWVLQRRHDIIVSGGENVYPAEVEAVLRRHPAVAEACVVGLNDDEWGQQVVAAVVLGDNAGISSADLLSFCRQYLAGYKLPRRLKIVPSLPRTASGKVHRHAVAELVIGN